MTERSKNDAEDYEKLSKALCDKVDRANEVARQEMSALVTAEMGALIADFQLLRGAGEGANPSGVDPPSPRSPEVDVDEEPADQEMEAPAPSPNEESVQERVELLQPQPVVDEWMLLTPSPQPQTPTSFFQTISPGTNSY